MKNFLKEAIKEAQKAEKENEIPIGAVIVIDDKIISRGHNTREKTQNALHHAEIIAINKACKKLKSWRLENAIIYVTLEPCPMCAGAIVNARIKKVVYGAKDKTSCDDICEKIFSSTRLNHKVEAVFEENEECATLLTNFFKKNRKTKTTN